MEKEHRRLRSIVVQVIFGLAVIGLAAWAMSELFANLERLRIRTGFAFLFEPSTVATADSLAVRNGHRPSYARSLIEGAGNTILATVLAVVFATIIGALAGAFQTSRLWLLSRLLELYVEVSRSVPGLVHVLFWYAMLRNLPPVREALRPLPGVIISNRGLAVPAPVEPIQALLAVATALIVAIAASWLLARRWRARRARLSVARIALIAVVALAPMAVAAVSLSWEEPRLQGLGLRGGTTISIELASLVVALSLYAGAYIAEIVRAGIAAIPAGQREAAASLGLSHLQTIWLIVTPQALRTILPQLPNEYIAILKGTSFAVAIGFHEISTTTAAIANNTGQAIEPMLILAAFYLGGSTLISLALNRYHESKLMRAYRR